MKSYRLLISIAMIELLLLKNVWGYLKSEDLGVNNIYIAYSAYWTQPHNEEWFKPLLLWHDQNNIAMKDSLFFDTFLIYRTSVKENNEEFRMYQWGNSKTYTNLHHWKKYLDILMRNDEELGGLNQAVVSLCDQKLLPDDFKAKVFIGIPYPDPRQEEFNFAQTGSYSFKMDVNRVDAITIFLGIVRMMWNEKNFTKLKLTGFYWIQESNFSDFPVRVERKFLKSVSNVIHQFKLDISDSTQYKFMIIPSMPNSIGLEKYDKPGIFKSDYELCGFDAIIIQPGIVYGNYRNTVVKQYANLKTIAEKADKDSFGMAIEFVPTEDNNHEKMLSAFYAHLEAGLLYGYASKDVVKTYWLEARNGADSTGRAYHGLIDLYRQEVPNFSKPSQRKIYDDLYKFVNGRYKSRQIEYFNVKNYILPENEQ